MIFTTTTFSTSLEGANAAGVKNLGANSRPTETTIDGFRVSAKTCITEIIGNVSDNTLGTAKAIEIDLVKKAIWAYLSGDLTHEIELSKNQERRLQSQFNSDFVFSFEPGANS